MTQTGILTRELVLNVKSHSKETQSIDHNDTTDNDIGGAINPNAIEASGSSGGSVLHRKHRLHRFVKH